MHTHTSFSTNLRQFLQAFARPGAAPDEIHGAGECGYEPGDDYHYQGWRYVYDQARDVLVREDMQPAPAPRAP
jgi:hypothetical protein